MATVATDITLEYAGGTVAREQTSLWRDGVRRLRRNRLALISSVYLTLLVIVAIIAFFWTPYSTTREIYVTYEGPSQAHLLGIDGAGRDILSRLMVGAQISLGVGFLSAAIVLFIG